MIKLKLISNGTPEGTYLVDEEGRTMDNVIELTWNLSQDMEPIISLKLVGIPVEIKFEPEFLEDGLIPVDLVE